MPLLIVRTRVLLFALLLGGAGGCAHAPPAPVEPALRANELCAQLLTHGDLERAEVHCDLGIAYSPRYADLWVNKALIAMRRGETERAKEHLIKAVRLNPEHAAAFNNLGFIALQEGQHRRACDHFKRALELNPAYREARSNLALAYRQAKDYPLAKKELLTLIELNPNLAEPHAQLGTLLLQLGDAQEQAIFELSTAVSLDPRYVDAWLVLGNAEFEFGRPCAAQLAFAGCLEADAAREACRTNASLAANACQVLQGMSPPATRP